MPTIIESQDCDLDALEPTRHTSLISAFERLCNTIELPITIVVRNRLADFDGTNGFMSTNFYSRSGNKKSTHENHGLQKKLTSSNNDYWLNWSEQKPHTTRRILFVVHSNNGYTEQSKRAIKAIAEMLNTAGLAHHFIAEDELQQTLLPVPPTRNVELTWLNHPTYMSVGDHLVRNFQLSRLPGIAVKAGWLRPLINIDANIDIHIALNPCTSADALGVLSRKLRNIKADQLVAAERGVITEAHSEVGYDNAYLLRDRLARNESSPLWLQISATALGENKPELERVSCVLKAGFAAILTEVTPLYYEQAKFLEQTVNAIPAIPTDSKLVEARAAATCTPWTHIDCLDSNGYFLGSATATNRPVVINPFDSNVHSNANMVILAGSGHGKSYAISTVVLAAHLQQTQSIIIDPEGEYQHLVNSLGGSYIQLAAGGQASINIFDLAKTRNIPGHVPANLDHENDVVGAVVDLVNIMCGENLDDAQRAHVDAAVSQVIAAKQPEVPVLADCIDELSKRDPAIAHTLQRFCSGGLKEIFSRHTTVQLDAPVIGISLRSIRKEFVPMVTFIVAEWIWQVIRRDQRQRHLVFDEVGLLCEHQALRTLLIQLARRCRKYQTSLIVATQNASDLLSTAEGIVIATNPAIALLGTHRGLEADQLRKAYSLTTQQQQRIEASPRGEFLLLAGSRRLSIQVRNAPLQHQIITGQSAAD